MPVSRLQLAAALTLMLCVPATAFAAAPSDAEQKLARLRENMLSLQADLKRARDEEKSLRGELREAEVAIGNIAEHLANIDSLLQDKNAQLGRLQESRAALRAQLAEHRSRLEALLRSAYIRGRQDTLKLLLNQEDPVLMGRIMTYHGYFGRARAERIERINKDVHDLAALEMDIRTASATLHDLKERQLRKQDELRVQRGKRAKLLAQLTRQIAEGSQRLRIMQEDEARLTKLLERLRGMIADIPPDAEFSKPFKDLRGRLPWPVKGGLVARFGSPRNVGQLKWQGVVLQATRGEPVRAVHHGRVAFADWLRGFGLMIILDHGDGYMSLYGYNQQLLKETGDWVSAGEPIAKAGDSGGRSEAGVYFGIRHNGTPRNPQAWCRREDAPTAADRH